MPCTKTESTRNILISYLRPLPANVQALLGNVGELLTSVTDGRSACESSETLSLNGLWRKMSRGCYQLTLDGSSAEYSRNWPKWGMMLDGEYLERMTSVRRIKGIDCALWPTVTINGNNNRKGISKKAGDGLATAVLWATPTASNCGMTSTTTGRPIEKSTKLQTQVYLSENWATPTASDSKGSTSGNRKHNLRNDVKGSDGQLNPEWVEMLMGYPTGWTSPDKIKSFDYFNKRSIWEVFNQLWPARRGEPQHGWEQPRTIKGMKGRAGRIKKLGNAVVPQWAFIPLAIIEELHRLRRTPPGSTSAAPPGEQHPA